MTKASLPLGNFLKVAASMETYFSASSHRKLKECHQLVARHLFHCRFSPNPHRAPIVNNFTPENLIRSSLNWQMVKCTKSDVTN